MCRFAAPFYHLDHLASDRVKVRDPVGITLSTEIIRLKHIRRLRIVSLDQAWMACDFHDADATAKIIKTRKNTRTV